MATINRLNTSWLGDLTNPHHDGTTQQIDDVVQAFETDNQVFLKKRAALHQARQVEDDVWLKSQRDDVVPLLQKADSVEDSYMTATRYTLMAHATLPDTEPTRQEAKQCLQEFKDFNFSTHDAYGAEADKTIQMQQNLQAHEAFLTQIGVWPYLLKAVEAARQVRQYLTQRAMTMGQYVKGEMKTARLDTDQAVAELYRTIEAMLELMPSDQLSALYTQLHGIELYARQYYLNDKTAADGSGDSNESNGSDGNNGNNDDDGPGDGTEDGTINTGGGSGSGSGGSNDGPGDGSEDGPGDNPGLENG